jgi:hypothetical protein
MDEVNQYLYAAISDAQQTIRSLDAKVSYAIAAQAAIVAALVIELQRVYQLHAVPPYLPYLIYGGLLSAIIAIYVAIKTILPRTNPTQHITWDVDGANGNTSFFLTSKKPFSCLAAFSDRAPFSKFTVKHSTLAASVSGLNDNAKIRSDLECELLKVSYIRDLKTKRLRYFFSFFLICFLLLATAFSLRIVTTGVNGQEATPYAHIGCRH